jgi:zinc transport system substrate-binding protein
MAKRIVAILTLLAATAAQARPPTVVASIQPLHSLAAAVMSGIGQPELLVGGVASEHSYTLKPSDIRVLQAADLVVTVAPDYETFLAKPLKGIRADMLAMADLPGVGVLPRREGGLWERHSHDDKNDHHGRDGHVWLNPMNAKILVVELSDRLSRHDPANATLYRANASRTLERLDALDGRLRARLAPLSGRSYVVFHDAYQYFEVRYGLSPAGSITVDPDRPPSAKRLAILRDRLKETGAACVFREPQFPAPVVAALAQSAGAREGVLDPQGADLPNGPDQYFSVLERLADSLVSCLSAR